MMVNAYPNISDIDDARSRRQIPLAPLPSFSHLWPEFIFVEETSILPPSSWTPRPAEFLIQAHHAR